MIIVKLIGGLGNQLFEYAAARRLAYMHNSTLKLDISDYSSSTAFRKYGLCHFNIKADIATPFDIFRINKIEGLRRIAFYFFGKRGIALIDRIYKLIRVKNNYNSRYYKYDPKSDVQENLIIDNIVSQRFFHFDQEVLNCPDNVIMIGTWISEKYFKDIKSIIKKELTIKYPLSGKNKEIANAIVKVNSISVHVRRTDKVKDSLCEPTSLDYCYKAMDYLKHYVNNPHYFIFSDDINWCKENLNKSNIYFVDHNNDEQNYEDLRLMSLCKHNIISESSFSWWAAWLNNNPQKIIISPHPSRWINLENFYTGGILPEKWIII